MFVLVGDAEVERLVLQLRRSRRGRLQLELLPARQPVALRASLAVDRDRACRQQAFGSGA
jgi:hypothetical protein